MEKPIRVLQVVTIMNRGGLETMLMNYYRKIDKSKIQFDFLVHRKEKGDYDDEIEKLGGKISRISRIKPWNYRIYFKELDNFFKQNQHYKIIHSHINENSSFVCRAARKNRISVRIAHSHTSNLKFDFKYPFRKFARWYMTDKNVTEYFACSEGAGKWLFSDKKFQILPNAIDTNEFIRNFNVREEIRKELAIENKFVIGHVGRFSNGKNHNFLIKIFNEVRKIDKMAVLLLVGEGVLENEIKKQVRDLNLEKDVIFLGIRDDVNKLMQSMDLFLFPSEFEGLPLVLVEAQASGLRCITSTGVTKESNITGNVEFYDLKISAKKWAEIILKDKKIKKDYLENIKKNGYDTNTNIVNLSSFYLTKQKMKETL